MIDSIFKEYYKQEKFIDRYVDNSEDAVDVIIPVFHTNELWEKNLYSIFREIPIKRLLVSDGGVIDKSLEILANFPRVEVVNHKNFNTLGKCIAELIKLVETDWFIYLHSDVYLPNNWFDKMKINKNNFDWFGCPMNITVMINYDLIAPDRPYAGSQFGRKKAFMGLLDRIDDDFVYRQEDFVFEKIVKDNGYKTGKVDDIFHYHQVMVRNSNGFDFKKISRVDVITESSESEDKRILESYLKGIVKYLEPEESWAINAFEASCLETFKKEHESYYSLKKWIIKTNPNWIDLYSKLFFKYFFLKVKRYLKKIIFSK
jgi:hypothetical protein